MKRTDRKYPPGYVFKLQNVNQDYFDQVHEAILTAIAEVSYNSETGRVEYGAAEIAQACAAIMGVALGALDLSTLSRGAGDISRECGEMVLEWMLDTRYKAFHGQISEEFTSDFQHHR